MSHVSGTIFIVRFFVISNRMFEYIRMQYIGRLRPLEISILFAASATGLSPFTHQVRDVSVWDNYEAASSATISLQGNILELWFIPL